MIQIVAKLRQAAACVAVLASLSVLSPVAAHAQAPPATPPATTPPAGKAAKKAKAPKASKPSKPAKPKPAEKPYDERRKVDGVYAKGANWIGFRAGYANRTGDVSGDGFLGYGMSYQRNLSLKYAFAAGIDHDVVGHFAKQIDVSVPFTGEFRRIFSWKGEMRPYLGLGGGFYYRKFYRTGTEYNTTTTGGGHVSIGFTSQLDDKHVVGFETRVAWLQGRPGVVNPTFGAGSDTETIWTAKLSWALVY